MNVRLRDLPAEELFTGSLGCPGCGGVMAARQALKVLGPNTILVMPAGCVVTVSCYYPQVPFKVSMMVMAFAATGAAVTGMVAGLRRKGRAGINVVGFAGDGGTADIGLQALSGAVERGDKFIYICYDNEAYMNTGVQRSSTTPFGAITNTTPGGKRRHFEANANKKDVFRMLVAQGIPYAATACVSYPQDYMRKIAKAMATDGPSYIHVLSPCPPGWGFASRDTVMIGRYAVESGMWPLLEWDENVLKVSHKPSKKRPVADYLRAQSRFRQLTDEEIERVQAMIDTRAEQPLA